MIVPARITDLLASSHSKALPAVALGLPSMLTSQSKTALPTVALGLLSSSASSLDIDDDGGIPPRARAVIYMASAMGLHFGGYEFLRNSCLALLTSHEFGFRSPAAFPLANGFISPFAMLLLIGYGRTLEASGPRKALRRTTSACLVFVIVTVASLHFSHRAKMYNVGRFVIGVAFLFQNSYQHLLYTQQWSFVSSIVTPDEGSKWFAILNGCSSLFCSFIGATIPFIVPKTGLLGLMMLTSVFLAGSLLCGDRAYVLSEQHGFDPDEHLRKGHSSDDDDKSNRLTKTVKLFERVPTLRALLCEVLAFQGLSTILNVAFVRALKENVPDDIARSSYTGRFYATVNLVSTTIQFGFLPWVMQAADQATLWRITPILPIVICLIQVFRSHLSLNLLATSFFVAKVMDYAFRSVTYIMVYQPLDFESRYLGKETIGLFGGRFGKSGMSLLLSAMTGMGFASLRNLVKMALVFNLLWASACRWLARLVPSQAEAQAIVEERTKRQKSKQIKEE